MKNKSVVHSILTGVFAVLLLAASSSIVRAECGGTSTWVDETGNWFTGTNWSPSGCVPTETIGALINNGGEAQILGGTANAASIILGDDQGDEGSVKVDGFHTLLYLGTSSCRGDIYVGNRGIGNLSISDEGHVNGRSAYVAAVANQNLPSSNGTVNVKGYDATLRLYDTGCSGAGLFIGCTATSNGEGGTANVDVSDGGIILVYRDDEVGDPGVTVGLSGTLTGNGTVFMASSSKKVKVLGTLAPNAGTLVIQGNLDLATGTSTANTIFHVTPTASDGVYVSSTSGGGNAGNAALGGRITVIMTGTFTPGMSFNLLYADAGRDDTTFLYESIIALSSHPCFTPIIRYPDDNSVELFLRPTCEE